jgi:hypothetical protein
MVVAIVAIVMSTALWLIGARLIISAQAQAVERLPDSWLREAPEEYAFVRSLRTSHVLRNTRHLLPLLALGILLFGLLTAFGVALSVQLGFSVALAVVWTGVSVSERRREQEAYRRERGLESLPRDTPLAVRYQGAFFVTCLGFLLFCLSVAQAGAVLVG